MLSLEEIKKYFPEYAKAHIKGMLREYLHYKILEILFSSEISKKLIFIGGTAIRIIHGAERFSEDLDFDNFDLSFNEFENVSKLVRKKLELEGFIVNIESFKKNKTFHYYIKIPKVLYDFKVSSHINERLLIKVDTEPQNFNYKPVIGLLNRFGVLTQIQVAPPEVLLSLKIRAILTRKRPIGRDFFDAVFLSSFTKPDYNFLKQELKISNAQELRRKLLEKCKTLNLNLLAKEVIPFLFNPTNTKSILLFREIVEKSDF